MDKDEIQKLNTQSLKAGFPPITNEKGEFTEFGCILVIMAGMKLAMESVELLYKLKDKKWI